MTVSAAMYGPLCGQVRKLRHRMTAGGTVVRTADPTILELRHRMTAGGTVVRTADPTGLQNGAGSTKIDGWFRWTGVLSSWFVFRTWRQKISL